VEAVQFNDDNFAAIDPTRPLIDQANRILMARRGCTGDEAYLPLVYAARRNGMGIGEFAECIVAADKLL
jgi:AmiR/NasT family two-component response regulator